jgi:hypothetical protein
MSMREQAFLQIVADVVLSDWSQTRLDASCLSPEQFADPDQLRVRMPESSLGDMDEHELCDALSSASRRMLQAFDAGGQPEAVSNAFGGWLRDEANYPEDAIKFAQIEISESLARACREDVPVRLILPLKSTNDYFYEGVLEIMDVASIRSEFDRLAKISKDLKVDELIHDCSDVAHFTVIGSGFDDECADMDPAQLRVFSNGDLAHFKSDFAHGQDVVRSESFGLNELETLIDFAKTNGVSTIHLHSPGKNIYNFCLDWEKTKAERNSDPLAAADVASVGLGPS